MTKGWELPDQVGNPPGFGQPEDFLEDLLCAGHDTQWPMLQSVGVTWTLEPACMGVILGPATP